jgi:hypothetical protein
MSLLGLRKKMKFFDTTYYFLDKHNDRIRLNEEQDFVAADVLRKVYLSKAVLYQCFIYKAPDIAPPIFRDEKHYLKHF